MQVMDALFTVDQYNQLPEGFPAQLIEGFLVKEPAPTYGHQHVGAKLFGELLVLVGPALAPMTPADVVLDEHNVYQPDVVVLREPPPVDQSDVGIPLIAIEVLSPRTRTRDRQTKVPRLLAAGVREVWIVDPEDQVVERWTSSGMARVRGDEALSSDAVPGFVVIPDELFSPPR